MRVHLGIALLTAGLSLTGCGSSDAESDPGAGAAQDGGKDGQRPPADDGGSEGRAGGGADGGAGADGGEDAGADAGGGGVDGGEEGGEDAGAEAGGGDAGSEGGVDGGSSIELVSTLVNSGYRIEYYRNLAYPCSIGGYQTFALAYSETQPMSEAAPLWVYLHGGAVGWFDGTGTPKPDTGFMTEESVTSLVTFGAQDGLMSIVRDAPAKFRLLVPSMCNRDLYSGSGQIDPHNPNLESDGSPKTTNGLLATEAAIAFTKSRLATTKYILHGGSAGSVGTYSLAWKLQQKGDPPAGIIADSFILNHEWVHAVLDQNIACPTAAPSFDGMTEVLQRIDPELGSIDNEPDKLVSSGRLTVPIAQLWNHGDPWGCGATLMNCPLRDGSTTVMGSSDCQNEPMRAAIAAQGPSSKSKSFGLCVDDRCADHIVTDHMGKNTDPRATADYNHVLFAWAIDRLADP